MATETKRKFEARPAVREATPLLLGLIGPSGTGKTYSALRLATGIQKVSGGEIFMIDTEARRGLHYADKFKFTHVPFGAPFGSLDYLDAINFAVESGAKVIIVDSMSHEHEGPGGVLEQHAAEVQRLAKLWRTKESVVQLPAWQEPKSKRRRMINSILQIPAHFIFCFRAKDKMKIVKGEDPVQLGFMPIAAEEFVYELVAKCLLLPGANGIPTWQSNQTGEQMMIKLPEQFRGMLDKQVQLSEDTGERLAKWAAGVPGSAPTNPADLLKRYAACSDPATYRTIEMERAAVWPAASALVKKQLKEAADATAARLKAAEEAPPADAPSEEEPPPDVGGELEPTADGQRF